MRAALTITAKDLRQRFRDRSAIVLEFARPPLALLAFAMVLLVAASARLRHSVAA